MSAGVRTPRKLLGWRRVLISGYPLWSDVAGRAKSLVKISVFSSLAFAATVAVSGTFLFFQYRNLPASTLVAWPRLVKDLTAREESEIPSREFPTNEDLSTARTQGCPVDLQIALTRKYFETRDVRLLKEFPWLREFADAKSHGELEQRLRERWSSWGFLDAQNFPNRESYGQRSSVEAVNVDIGECVSRKFAGNFLWFDWPKTNRALEMWGLLALPDLFTKEEISDVKRQLGLPEFAADASEAGRAVMAADGNIHHNRPQPNRLNLPIKGTRASDALLSVHAKLLPLVQSAAMKRWGENSRVWLGDARIIILDNGGIAERRWHRADETGDGPGFTAFIPLDRLPTIAKSTSKPTKAGLMRVLPGSHILGRANRAEALAHFHHIFKISGGVQTLDGVLLADSDLLVRGEENAAFTVRSYLKLSYRLAGKFRDERSGPAPASLGGVFEKLSWIYSKARAF